MRLNVTSSGQGADLVCLHGWGLHAGVFDRVAVQLSAHYCVHLVDLPGHGQSERLDPYRGEQVARALCEQFPFPVHVLGWSLGGLIAQYWALMAPLQVRSLVLTATSPCFIRKNDWPHAQDAQTILAVGQSLEQDFTATLERFLALQMLGSNTARATLITLRTQLFAHGQPQGLLPALQLLLDADLRQDIRAIDCPVSLLYGKRDVITPVGAGQWLADSLANASLQVFEHASHAPFLSHEDEFMTRLSQHMELHG